MATEPKGPYGRPQRSESNPPPRQPSPAACEPTFATGSSLRSTESEQVVRKQIHDDQFHLKEEDFSQLRRR